MKKLMDSYQLRTWLSFLLLATAVIVIYSVSREIYAIWSWTLPFFRALSPFLWGFALSYMLNIPREGIEKLLEFVYGRFSSHPVASFIAKRKFGLSILLTYISVLLILVIIMNIVVPPIYASILDFIEFLPVLFYRLETLIIELDANDNLPFFEIGTLLNLLSWDEILAIFSTDNITSVFETIMDLSGTVFNAALAVISSVYFLIEGGKLKAFLGRVLKAFASPNAYGGVLKYCNNVNGYFKRYIFCQVLDAVILGIIMTIATSLLGVRYALVIGPMLGVANLIPYFGSIFGTVIAIIIIMFTESFTFGLICAAVLLIIQQIDSNIIFPRLLGGSMKISPLLVIIAIAVGNAYYGIVGMVIAIPISTVLKNIIDDILTAREHKKTQASEEVAEHLGDTT